MNSVPPRSGHFPSLHQWTPLGAIAGGIFVIDLIIPLGVATAVLYVAVVFMSLRYRDSQLPMWTALGCSVLTIIAVVLSPVGGELWKVLLNRTLTLFVIWTTTLMGRFQLQQVGTIQRQDHTIQSFIEGMPSACFTFDRKGIILSWNAGAEKIYGYSKTEAIGASSFDLIVTPETQEGTKKVIEDIFQGKAVDDFKWHGHNKQGELGWRIGNLFPVFNRYRQVVYGVNMNIDITASQKTEAEVEHKNALLEAILHSSQDAIYAKDRQGKYLMANAAAAAVIGTTPEMIIGMDDTQLFGTENANALKQFDDMVLLHTESLNYEGELFQKGHQKFFSTSKSRLKDAKGASMGVLGVSRDITEWKQAQQDLLLTERLFIASPDHISILDRDYRYRRVNATYLRVHQKFYHEIIGLSAANLLGQEIFEQTIKPNFDQCLLGEEVHYETWITFPDTQRRYMAVSYLPLVAQNNQIEKVAVLSRDLTARKQAEDALQANERQLRTVLDAMTNFVGIGTVDGLVEDCNQTSLTMAGLTREDVIGKSFIDTYWLNYSPTVQEQVRKIIRRVGQGEIVREDILARMGENHFITIDACYVPIKDRNGQVVQIVHSGIDVTPRRAAEAEVQANEKRLRSLLDSMMCFVGIWTPDGTFIDCNQFSLNASRLQKMDVIGKHITDTYWVNDSPETQQQLRTIFHRVQQGEIVREDIKIRSQSQASLIIDANYVPIKDKDANIVQVIGTGIDVTARRAAEEALRHSDKQFRDLYESAPLAFFSASPEGYVTKVNSCASELLGYSREELIGMNVFTLYAPTPDGQEKAERLQQQSQGSTPINGEELEMMRKDGRHLWVSLTVRLMYNNEREIIERRGIVQDISQRKQIEQELHASEYRFRSLVETAGSIIIGLTLDGWIVEWNREAERVFGKSRSEVLDKNYLELFIHENHRSKIMADIEKVLSGDPTRDFEYPVIARDGHTRQILWNVDRLLDETQHAYGVIAIGRDITEWKAAEETLQRQALMFNTIYDGVLVTDLRGTIIDWNPGAEHMFGYNKEEVLGHLPALLHQTSEKDTLTPHILEKLTQDGRWQGEIEFVRKDGTQGICEAVVVPLCNAHDQQVGTIGVNRDITERKQRETMVEAIHHVEREFIASHDPSQLFDQLLSAILSLTQSEYGFIGEVLNTANGEPYLQTFAISDIAWNEKTRALYRSQAPNIEFHNLANLFGHVIQTGEVVIANAPKTDPRSGGLPAGHPDMHAFLGLPVFQSDALVGMIGIANRPGGYDASIQAFLQPILISCGTLIEAYKNERRRREVGTGLKESEERLALALEATSSGTWDWNIETGKVLFSQQWTKGLGYQSEEVPPHVSFWKEIVHSDDLPDVQEALQKHFSGETASYECITRLRMKSGEWRWNFDCGRVVEWTKEGKPLRMVGTDTDITERKRAEEALIESQQIYHDLVQTIEGIVWECDFPSFQVTFVSHYAKQLLGYPLQQWHDDPQFLENMIHADDRQKTLDYCHQASLKKENHIMEYRVPHANGSILWLRDQVTVVVKDDQPVKLRGIMVDITEQKKIDSELKESEQRFRTMFEQAAVGVAQVNSYTGEFIKINQRYCDIVGYSQDEMHGRNFQDITHPDDLQVDLDNMSKLLSGELTEFSTEKRYFRKDGRPVWVTLTVAPMGQPNENSSHHITVVEDITNRKNLEDTVRQQHEKLEETVQRRTERIQELEQRRMQVEKLAALAQIAAGVAHEINNPLASISQSLVLLKRAIPPEHPHFRYMAKAEDCIERISQITKKLYQLYRPSSPIPMPVDIRMCIRIAIEIMEERASKQGIRLNSLSYSQPVISHVSQGELIQILCNLIHNAIDASTPEDQIEISLTTESKTLLIFVADHGVGILPEDAPHIFEPFYTTKQNKAEGGMGLGLSISQSLVKAMGGSLDFSPSIGPGSTFTITLPRE